MTNKMHYHDYALYAFRTFNEEPKTAGEALNRIAVANTLHELTDNERNIVANVYMIPEKPRRGTISNRVEVSANMFFVHPKTIYNVLAKARKKFALHRELI